MDFLTKHLTQPRYIRKPRNKVEEIAYIFMHHIHGYRYENINEVCTHCLDLAKRTIPEIAKAMGVS